MYIGARLCALLNSKFQVVWLGKPTTASTWVSAASLPMHMISEYEDGVRREVVEEKFSSGGQTIHTLTSQSMQVLSAPQNKRPRIDIPSSETTG